MKVIFAMLIGFLGGLLTFATFAVGLFIGISRTEDRYSYNYYRGQGRTYEYQRFDQNR